MSNSRGGVQSGWGTVSSNDGRLTVLRRRLSDLGVYLEITRPGNVAFTGALAVIGAFVAGGVLTRPLAVCAAVVAATTVTAGGNTINDYFDRHIDAVNRPERPIPRGAISARTALLYSLGLFGTGFVASLLLPLWGTVIVVGNALGLLAYTQLFKPLPGVGNALIAVVMPSNLLLGGAAVGDVRATVVLFALAAIATLSREIIKDVEDIDGDRREGLRTLPIAIGESPSLWFGLVSIVVAVAASVLPYLTGTFGTVYLVAVLPANVTMLAAASYAFVDPGSGQRWLKIGMVFAALAFVVGRGTLLL